ncbi:unnamed protein product [Kuraishia capsulata CBS 1993]|uniref:Zn(2)-C6 fungal-type domain-containing protein n=1 Tax=Kuraishia capsulata CBS 1993 TaxID=1382522 RepID=W6MN73_9ASCO|nr:uncharacterized protein KUCA_T00004070001 [Kuraishia capsulata CBS 1993]CDK28089.1 unnamed protein product [Kuraishia capsulata CBS 1993]
MSAVESVMPPDEPRRKRRKYSRNGCRECKRRKLKCDEGKPSCWQCEHLNKECTYVKVIKFDKSRSFTVTNESSEGILSVNEDLTVGSGVAMSQNPSLQESSKGAAPKSRVHNSRPAMVNVPRSESSAGSPPVKQPIFLPRTSNTDQFVPEPSTFQYNSLDVDTALFNDASLLINDLNDLIYMNMPYPGGTGVAGSTQSDSSLSPASYSVHSVEELANSEYVKSLTQTLQNDFGGASAAATPIGNFNGQIGGPGMDSFYKASNAKNGFYPETYQYSHRSPAVDISTPMGPPRTPNYTTENEASSAVQLERDMDLKLRKVLAAFPKSALPKGSPDSWEYLVTLNNSISPNDLVALANYFEWSTSSSHIHYMKIFITKIHMNCLPFTTSFLHNSFINCFLLQAKRSPHLLFAMLAMAARYEYYQCTHADQDPNMLLKNRKEAKFHNKIRSYYLSSCLKALDSILDDKEQILQNVESLLLTILILASDYSASRGSQWRAHLRGAKDLLIKYCRFKPMILDLAIAKVWFYSMESLAGLTVPSGGTIHGFDELGEFLEMGAYGSVGHTLRYYGIAIDGHHVGELGAYIDNSSRPNTAYNIYLGFNDDVIDIIRELILVIESTRWIEENKKDPTAIPHPFVKERINSKGQATSTHILNIMQLILKARSFEIVTNVSPYRVPLTSNCHPHFNGPKNAHVPPSLLLHRTHPKMRSENESENWFSWYDLSQQLYIDASYLRLLVSKNTFGHSIDNPLVQDVVTRMLEGLSSMVKFDNEAISKADETRLNAHYNGKEQLDSSPFTECGDKTNGTPSADAQDLEKDDKHDEDSSLSEDEPMSPSVKLEEGPTKSGVEFMAGEEMDDEEDESKLNIVKEASLSSHPNRNKMLNFDKYMYYQFDNRIIMIHWPLFVCGLCCVKAQDKAIIECCFKAFIRLGVGSGEITLRKLKKLWRQQKKGLVKRTHDVFVDDKDSLPFT